MGNHVRETNIEEQQTDETDGHAVPRWLIGIAALDWPDRHPREGLPYDPLEHHDQKKHQWAYRPNGKIPAMQFTRYACRRRVPWKPISRAWKLRTRT